MVRIVGDLGCLEHGFGQSAVPGVNAKGLNIPLWCLSQMSSVGADLRGGELELLLKREMLLQGHSGAAWQYKLPYAHWDSCEQAWPGPFEYCMHGFDGSPPQAQRDLPWKGQSQDSVVCCFLLMLGYIRCSPHPLPLHTFAFICAAPRCKEQARRYMAAFASKAEQ